MRWPSWISGFPDQKISRHSQWVNRTKDFGNRAKSNTEHCGSSISKPIELNQTNRIELNSLDCVRFSRTQSNRIQWRAFSNGFVFGACFRRCSVDDSRTRSKTAPFSFENGLVWTGPLYQRNLGGQIIINKTAQISKPSKSWFGCVRVKNSQWWNAAEKAHKHRQEA